jgi:hypothetical protein
VVWIRKGSDARRRRPPSGPGQEAASADRSSPWSPFVDSDVEWLTGHDSLQVAKIIEAQIEPVGYECFNQCRNFMLARSWSNSRTLCCES